jgi:hypothetical protein
MFSRQFVVTAGNEDLVADLMRIGAVGVRRGAGGQVRQAGAGLRLGQRHGAEEAARSAAGRGICPSAPRCRSARSHWRCPCVRPTIRGGAAVGALEQRRAGLCVTTTGSCMPPCSKSVVRRQQAGGAEGVERLAHLGNHAHAAVRRSAARARPRLAVVRGELFFGHGQRRVQRGVEGLPAVLGVARALRSAPRPRSTSNSWKSRSRRLMIPAMSRPPAACR